MGGFYLYDHGKERYPLDRTKVLELVKRRELIPCTSDEIKDKGQADAVSKALAVMQTIWFAVQCIARRVQNLPVIHLEVMTGAYCIITVAMYVAWWHKPQNVECPTRIFTTSRQILNPDAHPREVYPTWKRILLYSFGNQDKLVDLSHRERVPTFWSDDRGDMFDEDREDLDAYFTADIIALITAMLFGAVHCVAWSYAMPTEIEGVLWKAAAGAITAVPVIVVLGYLASAPILLLFPTAKAAQAAMTIVALACAIAYISGRVTLLILSVTSLRSLPMAAYQTVSWTTDIPHI